MKLALLIVAAMATAASADTIHEIYVQDNTKTTSDTVEYLAGVSRGDEWTPGMSDEIQRRLETAGLFKDISVYWEPAKDGKGVDVHILVKDKLSKIVAPAFYNQPTNFGGGLGYGDNNLFGQNQKLLLYGQVATGDSFFIGAWVVPSIAGSRFDMQADVYLADFRNFEYAPPTKYVENPASVRESRLIYLNAGYKIGFRLFRGVTLDTRVRGAKVRYDESKLVEGATIDQVTGDPTSTVVPKPGIEGWDISNETDLTIDRRANFYGVTTGGRFQIQYERSINTLSDFHYSEVQTFGSYGWKVLDRHNLVLKENVSIGHHLPFQQEYLMGGTSMRGWLNNQFRGDTKLALTAEYSFPLFTIKGLGVRGLGFWDTGYLTFTSCGNCAPGDSTNPQRNYLPNSDARGLAPFKNSVGIGTRLFMRQIVLPLLGLDVGYGLEAGDVQVYLAIGLTD